MSHSSIFVTGDQIIADVTSLIGDERMKLRSEGWMVGKLRDALRELAFDTFFHQCTYDGPVPSDLSLKLPSGLVDIVDVFLYNGDVCEGATAVRNVYFKKGFTRTDSSKFAKNAFDNNLDRIIESAGVGPDPVGLHYFGLQNNYMNLSDSALAYQNIRIAYKGLPGDHDLCSAECVPWELKAAVVDYIAVEACTVIFAHDKTRENRALLDEMKSRKLGYGGSWERAKVLVRRVHSKQRNDWAMYMTKLGYGR